MCESCFGTSEPVQPEWYHGLTENWRGITIALCYSPCDEVVGGPPKDRQRICNSSGVACVYGANRLP